MTTWLDNLAGWLQRDTAVVTVMAILLAGLAAGSVVQAIRVAWREPDDPTDRIGSLGTWWIIAGCLTAALITGRPGLLVLLGAVGLIGMGEFWRCFVTAKIHPAVCWALYAAAVSLYVMLALLPAHQAMLGGPMAVLIVLGLALVVTRPRLTGGALGMLALAWGLPVYMPAFLAVLPDTVAVSGPLLVIVLTEFNDIAAAWIGKTIGRRKIVPRISPGKTWAGTVGGVVMTGLLGAMIAPWMISMTWPAGLGLGLLLGVGGFFGDINMSALKRRRGIKDTSHLLPGHGGMLDRIDSLTFTAPLTFVYLHLL